MRHAIVAYPKLEEPDRFWIETVRARHDPQAALIAGDFTLMFPALVDLEVVKAAAVRAAGAVGRFDVVLDRAAEHRDAPGSPSLVFLLPKAGDRELRRLHEVLYDGVLSPWLDLRIPYLPHMTVAARLTETEAGRLRMISTVARSGSGVPSTLSASCRLMAAGCRRLPSSHSNR
jgi:2'-5' RNA ligase